MEKEEKKAEEGRVGALDAGERTFQAFISEKEYEEIAPDMEKVACAMKKKIDGIRRWRNKQRKRRKGGIGRKARAFDRRSRELPRLGTARMREPATW